jgi:hypothetical protein
MQILIRIHKVGIQRLWEDIGILGCTQLYFIFKKDNATSLKHLINRLHEMANLQTMLIQVIV